MIDSNHILISKLRAFVLLGALAATAAGAEPAAEEHLRAAQQVIGAFTNAGGDSIPAELLGRARAIAVLPNVFRGGFILGGRRGRGVLSVRLDDGTWSNPAFVILTGGSIGWQIGAESTDVVLVFANENAVRNIAGGKFTLGGEATAIAGPLRKHASSTMTFRAEVYGYQISQGLYAGAAFQGARLKIDDRLASRFYDSLQDTQALGRPSAQTPVEARRFLDTLEQAELAPATPVGLDVSGSETEEVRTFPLPD